MPLWFLLTLALGQAPRPSAPANMAVRDATATATVSSGEDAYITWTVDPSTTGMAYDISLDGGPWVAIAPADLQELEVGVPSPVRTYAVNRGKLTPGQHIARVRECTATRTTCAPPAQTTVAVVAPVACQMGSWGPWGDWTDWTRAGAVDVRQRTRYRAITTFPGAGADPCPPSAETIPETRPYVPPPLEPVTVAFVRMDSTTNGAWKGVYGSAGQVFAGVTTQAPSIVKVTPSAAGVWTWADHTTDERGPQRPDTTVATDRFAVTWYGTVFELDVKFQDALVHEVALYAVDWDSAVRAQT